MKLKVFSLEYASQNQPNPSKRRDFPGCSVSSDKERRVYQRRAHSFHLKCLGIWTFAPFASPPFKTRKDP